MKKLKNDFEAKYMSMLQTHVALADTQFLIGEVGRGAGKTSEMFSPRLVRVAYDMPRSTLLLVGPTYTFLLETVVPAILAYLAKNYTRGIHYEHGKLPPKHFRMPYFEVAKWDHTISFAWGTVIQFVSIDRPESAIGKNAAHVFADEMLRIKETDFIERIMPTLRGDRSLHGHSHYFAGFSLFSSTPNFENDHDWWLNYEENMDKELIEKIKYMAYLLMQEKYKFKTSNNDSEKKARQREINRLNKYLNTARTGAYCYVKGSSFSNIAILTLDYIKNQYQGAKHNIDKFNLSILGIRPKKVKDRFFSHFTQKNIFEDSYKYNHIDLYSVDGKYRKTSRDLKYCDPNKPIVAGYDPGNFQSIVMGQNKKNTLNLFKNFFSYPSDQGPGDQGELVRQINSFFEYHSNKHIYLYYDRAGNQRKYKNNKKGETDAQILKTELQALGWTVTLMSTHQRTIFYWEHFNLQRVLFAEKIKRIRVRICQNECEELISSINMSPRKKSEDGMIELDKSSERKLPYEMQAMYSTQIASAMTYLLWGLFGKFAPASKPELVDYENI